MPTTAALAELLEEYAPTWYTQEKRDRALGALTLSAANRPTLVESFMFSNPPINPYLLAAEQAGLRKGPQSALLLPRKRDKAAANNPISREPNRGRRRKG